MNLEHMKFRVLDLFMPRTHCMVCDAKGEIRLGLCPACLGQMERVCGPVCPLCGRPSQTEELCAQCRKDPPEFAAARSVYLYRGVVRELVRRMKYLGEYDLPARIFSQGMAQAVQAAGWRPQAVVAVPSHRHVIRTRGYNQADILASRVARQLRLPHVTRALERVGYASSQVKLSSEDRRRNLSGSMQPGRAMQKLAGKPVLLVDDVLTTGSTAREVTRTLLSSGAGPVYVVCAAVSVRRDVSDAG